jgi:hypothetical protein
MKTHGDPGWETFPSYLDVVIPRVLKVLKDQNLTITFFIVGQDAALEKNRNAIQSIATAGHEIGNHSYDHEPWLHTYNLQQIRDEIAKASWSIEQITGSVPIGFRGPGYTFSNDLLLVLAESGYLYDASTLPTFLGPLARAYYFMTSKLSPSQIAERKKLFGTLSDGFRPNRPHYQKTATGKIIEIPVTTLPIFRIPFHVSYILYLSSFSPWMGLLYFRVALWLCKLTGTRPSLLLHPLDFLDEEEVPELSFFPAMKIPREKKMKIVREVIRLLTKEYNVIPLKASAIEIVEASKLTVTNAYIQ